MYNAKYKKEFSFKTLNYSDFLKLLEIIDTTKELSIENISISRKIKINGISNNDSNNFNNIKDLKEYLNEDIKHLDKVKICIKVNEKSNLELEYNDIYNKWILSFNDNSMVIDGLILNLKSVFRFNFLDFVKSKKNLIFWIVWITQVVLCVLFKIGGIFSIILSFSVIILSILNFSLKLKPYSNNNFYKKHRDLILNFIFYVLGVITPYLIDYVRNRIK